MTETTEQSHALEKPSEGQGGSYLQILKSSVLIGGASVIAALIGAVRGKATALILGPAGFGLMGVFSSIIDVAASVAGFGVGWSGVREIASKNRDADKGDRAAAISLVKRLSIVLGIVGAFFVVVLASPISEFAFESAAYAGGVALLSLAVMFRVMTGGYGAVLQGLRKIPELALSNVIGTLLGAATTIIILLLLQERGIVPALIVSTLAGLAITWLYERRLGLPRTPLKVRELIRGSYPLFRLGTAFMIGGFLVMGTALVVRVFVVRGDGLEAAGFYHAAWTLSGLYVGMILQAMSTDFYPRLSGVSDDDMLSVRYINEQTEVSLLLAAPGIVITLASAPLLMIVFYSGQFLPAVDVLRCLVLGMALKVVSWPLGFLVIARGRQNLFILLDAVWATANVVLAFYLISELGIVGAGWAFFGAYAVQYCLAYWIAKQIAGFRYTPTCIRFIFVYFAVVSAEFVAFAVGGDLVGYLVSAVLFVFTLVFAIRSIGRMVPIDVVPDRLVDLLTRLRLLRA